MSTCDTAGRIVDRFREACIPVARPVLAIDPEGHSIALDRAMRRPASPAETVAVATVPSHAGG